MNTKLKTYLRRGIAGALGAVMLGFALFSPFGESKGSTAIAAASLPHITSLVNRLKGTSGQAFNILEIVPTAQSGSMGYYVDGPATGPDWLGDLAALTSQDERESYMNAVSTGYLTRLEAAGLLGAVGTKTRPMTRTASGGYREWYPWEETAPADAQTLTLDKTNVFKGSGTMTETENGDFKTEYRYIPKPSGAPDPHGEFTYVYNEVDYFEHFVKQPDQEAASEFVFRPTFAKITAADDVAHFGDSFATPAIYWRAIPPATDPITEPGPYEYAFQWGDQDLEMDEHGDLIYDYAYINGVGNYGPPILWSDCVDSEAYYIPVITEDEIIRPVVDGETGYFKRETTGNYVWAEGKGDMAFNPDSGSTQVQISYTFVKYDKGFVSNDWLLKHVLNTDPSEYENADAYNAVKEKVRVHTVTADKVTANQIAAANLIVLSAGFDLENGGAAAGSYSAANDLDGTMTLALLNRASVDSKTAVIIDYRVTQGTSSTHMRDLARYLASRTADYAAHTNINAIGSPDSWPPSQTNKVVGNLYTYNPTVGAPGFNALANGSFATDFQGNTAAAAGFAKVLEEIKYENFLRENAGETERLTVELTMANAVRYILNYGGQRVVNKKTSIKVLEIEPRSGKVLTAATVLGWLPDGHGLSARDVTITQMSTAEFIGRIDDLNETYDLIYVGDSTAGFEVDGSDVTSFTDTAMNGLLYMNMGDKVMLKDTSSAGQLDRDYSNPSQRNSTSTYIYSLDDIKTYRYPGNDITRMSAAALESFATAGYPIIFADSLFNLDQKTVPFAVDVVANGNTSLTASVRALGGGSLPSGVQYQWYRDGAAMSGETRATFTPSGNTAYDAQVYCQVTYSGGGTAGVSNSYKVKYTPGGLQLAHGSGATTSTVSQTARWYVEIERDRNTLTTTVTNTGKTAIENAFKAVRGRDPGAGDITYTFQYQEDGSNIRGATSATYAVAGNGSYTCRVTFSFSDGKGGVVTDSLTPDTLERTASRNWPYYQWDRSDRSTNGTFNYTIPRSIAITNPAGALTGSLQAAASPSGTYYRWYKDGASDGTGASYTATEGTYYVELRSAWWDSSEVWARSNSVIVSNVAGGITFTAGADGTSGAAAIATGSHQSTSASPNHQRVDNCTNLYALMDSLRTRSNVLTVSDAGQDKELLLSYLNLSKPSLTLTGQPTPYVNTTSALTRNGDGTATLSYAFTIENHTDPTPASTTYDVKLYIDTNADGRYRADEDLSDIVVRQGGALVNKRSGVYTLTAGVTYTITRTMPSDYVGIIPWQLQVTKNGSEHIHDSVQGLTRMAPIGGQPLTKIQVLQILSDGSNAYNKNNLSLATNATYREWLPKVADFDIGINAVVSNGNVSSDKYNTTLANPKWSSSTSADAIFTMLNQYDMLILGFGDCFGTVNANLSDAVLRYIDSGKAVLFTHDTTSFINVASESIKRGNSANTGASSTNATSGAIYWGYYFNTVLRAKVGLDYYGVMDGAGKSALSLALKKGTVGVTTAQTQLENGYNVAYLPTTTAAKTYAERVEGYNAYHLQYSRDGEKASFIKGLNKTRDTKTVTQTNRGQITTYPFDINTAAFGGSASKANLTVSLTHFQYYTLNMNREDIVVWYCLGGSGNMHSALPNDAANSYYIYTMGNVTYSGVGHAGGNEPDEAKLFINTMVASFRTASMKPNVEIKNAEGSEIDYVYFSAMDASSNSVVLEKQTPATDESRAVYFSFMDANLGPDKTTSVKLYYEVDSTATGAVKIDLNGRNGSASTSSEVAGTTPVSDSVKLVKSISQGSGIQCYSAIGTAIAGTGKLQGGVDYKFYVTDDMLDALAQKDKDGVTIYVEVVSLVDGKYYSSFGEATLRKIGLRDLN